MSSEPTPEEKAEFIALRKRIVDAALPEIEKCTVPMYLNKNGNSYLNGTGVLFRIGSKHFVLSAAHVLDYTGIFGMPYLTVGAENNLTFLRIKRTITTPPPPGRDQKDIDMRDDDPLDIGVGELWDEDAEKLAPKYRFCQLMEIGAGTGPVSGIHAIFGYPMALWTPDHVTKTYKSGPLSFTTHLYEGPRHPRDDKAELLLAYPERNSDGQGSVIDMPSPKGISGRGIWRLHNPLKPFDAWKPEDVRLVGIDHRWRRVERYLIGSLIDYPMGMVYRNYKDLHPAMGLTYAKPKTIFPF